MGINEYIRIGKKMKMRRIELGIQQEEIARQLGLSKSTYSNYENEHREPPLEVITKFCEILNISINYLIDPFSKESLLENVAPEDREFVEWVIDHNSIDFESGKDFEEYRNALIDEYNTNNLLKLFHQLNEKGQDKAIEQVEMLTKIEEYKK